MKRGLQGTSRARGGGSDAKRYSKVYDRSLYRPFENHLGYANRRSSLYDNTSALPASRLLFQFRKLGLVNLSRVTVAPVMPSAPPAAVVLGNFSSALHHLTLQWAAASSPYWRNSGPSSA